MGFIRVVDPALPGDAAQSLIMAATLASSGLLLAPSAIFSLARLLGKRFIANPFPTLRLFRPSLLILALPFVLILGQWSLSVPGLTGLVLPLMQVLAVSLPVMWLVYLGLRRLPSGSPQRLWGIFGSGMTLGPALILVAEGFLGFFFLLFFSFYVAGRPDLAKELLNLADWMRSATPSPDILVEKLSPYVLKPGVIFFVLLFGAVLVPLIEEFLKPIGVWLLASRRLSATEGFVAGTLSGAGYALFESLSISGYGDSWASVVIARIGTAAVHIFTTGLVGWGLACAFRKKRFVRLGLAYLAAVLVHGLWNGATLLTSFSALSGAANLQVGAGWLARIGLAGPFGLGVLILGTFIGLIRSNRMFRRSYQRWLASRKSGETDPINSNSQGVY
jgi:RsiW-degrading membrane proteinase PrsW (M82 family)